MHLYIHLLIMHLESLTTPCFHDSSFQVIGSFITITPESPCPNLDGASQVQELFICLVEAVIKTTSGFKSGDFAYLVDKPAVAGAVPQTA